MPELAVLAEQLLADVPGGTGRYTGELLSALAASSPPGWVVRPVVARHGRAALATVPRGAGIAPVRVLSLPRRALAAGWQRGLPYWPGGDSVHAPTPLAPPRQPGRGLVVTVHDTVPWTHPDTLTRHGAAWHRAMIGRASKDASALVVPTHAVARELALHIGGAVPIHPVGHGVSTQLYGEMARAELAGVAARHRLPRRFVLAVGTVEPRKGIDVLIRAMAGTDAPDVPLVLVGPAGWGAVDPTALALEHGFPPDRLYNLGVLSDHELAAVLRLASVLAVPSRAEGFGLPVLEAMAAGVPVVHSDVPALVEVAGDSGLRVRTGDPVTLAHGLRAVLDEPRRADELVRQGYRRAAEFSWHRAAEAVWTVHRQSYEARAGSRNRGG